MQILESKLERDCVEWAGSIGYPSFKIQKKKGWPDRGFLMGNERVIFVEFKRENEVPGELQDHIHKMLSDLDYEVWVIDNKEYFENVLLNNCP